MVFFYSKLEIKNWVQYFNYMLGKFFSKVPNVGTPPFGKHVARISQWHVVHVINRTIIIRTITIRIPLRIRMMQFSYPDHFKEKQMTF